MSRRSTEAATPAICRATAGPTRRPTAISASSSTTTSSGTRSSRRPAAPICVTSEWTELLIKADVPVMPMHDLEGVLSDPHLVATDFFPVVEHPTEGPVRSMRVPANWSDSKAERERLAPRLNEHGEAILRDAGFSSDEIAAMIRDGVTVPA